MKACRLCGCITTTDKYYISKWTITECSDCGFAFVYPIESDSFIHDLYKNNYFSSSEKGYENYEDNKNLRKETFKFYYDRIKSSIHKKNAILDIGCSDGSFLQITKQQGFEINEGIELNEEMFQLTSAEFKLYNKPLESFEPDMRYDLITLFDVIEHIPDLKTVGEKLKEICNPGGLLVILTPDYNSTSRKIKGKKWFQFKPIEHINYFSRENLATFLIKNGFSIQLTEKGYSLVDYRFITNRLKKYNYRFLYFLFLVFGRLLFIKKKYIKISSSSIFLIAKRDQ